MRLRHGASSLAKLIIACAVFIGQYAIAQDAYPTRIVKLIVPYAAGGSTDATARLFAQGVSTVLGHQVVVENRPGANGLIGTESVARAPADGYTLLFGPIATNAIAGSLYTNLRYDPIEDFVAITEVARTPLLLVVGPSVPAKTLAEFQAHAKGVTKKLNYASGGQGTASHIAAELFSRRVGVEMQHVPYKGSGLALNDVMGGHADVMFDSIATSLQNVRSGKLKALGISTISRSAIAPEIPTLAEAGLPGFAIAWWFGLFAPRGTPQSVVDKLATASVTVLGRPEVRAAFIGQGLEPVGSSPSEFGSKVVNEAESWGKIIRDAGIRVE
jgi:tripartite-type tricarboxylate transporter receptor subunit TctC